jgi:tol-pal system protein YbgF
MSCVRVRNFVRARGERLFAPALLLASAVILSAVLPGCSLFGEPEVKRPEFEDLKGRVTNVEDIVTGRQSQGPPYGSGGVAPGAGRYTPPGAAAPPSAGSEKSRYNRALSMVKGRRYAQAAEAFQSFLSDYPNGKYSPNARYWLGETYYARGDFSSALAEFQRGARDFPGHAKAPDCLLKAAYSQSKLGDGPGAMESLRALLEYYPGSRSAKMVVSGRYRLPTP